MRNRISRRDFLKTAVAVGGSTGLSACLELGEPDVPMGVSDPSVLPERQHAWNEYLGTDTHGNVVAPRHRVLLLLDYAGNDIERDREATESALTKLEKAYKRGNDGLLFTLSYSPAYFESNNLGLDGVDLQEPRALASIEDPVFDENDAVLHIASDYPHVVLSVEEALFGEVNELNGVQIEESLNPVFEEVDRRTGFVGKGLPSENQGVDGIPDSEPVPSDAPLYMGFKSGFQKNQASEDSVTIQEGRFAGGTTQHVSKIDLNLQQWYEQDSRYQRVGKMFCPIHAEEGLVEGAGENLGDSAGMEERGCPAHTSDHAEEYGMVGHSQKSARARRNGSPIMIRRDFDSTDGNEASLHFVALQRGTQDFVDTREAMNGSDIAEDSAVGQRTNNGILQYMDVERRGNFLLPPRSERSLPM